MDDDDVGRVLRQITVYRHDRPGRQSGERLVGLHQVQVRIRGDSEDLQHLIEHLAMLAGDTDVRLEFRMLLQFQHQGTELDGLRPGTEDERDLLHESVVSCR